MSDTTIGNGDYVVKKNDCINSIAFEHGFFWKTVWNHPDNKPLRDVRKDPNALLAGDRVTIPEKANGQGSGASGGKSAFKIKGVPAMLNIQFKEDGEPLADETYRLDIDGELREGALDGEGFLHEPIAPNAKLVKIYLEDDTEPFKTFELGALDPASTTTGIQARLNNLGFAAGAVDGETGDRTRAAIRAFQKTQGFEESGEVDAKTRDAIESAAQA